jgi:hypothetical protein
LKDDIQIDLLFPPEGMMQVATGFDDENIDKFREQVRLIPDEEVKVLRSIYGVLCRPSLGSANQPDKILLEKLKILREEWLRRHPELTIDI